MFSLFQLRERSEDELKEYILENSPSIMLMSLLKGLTRKKKELDRVSITRSIVFLQSAETQGFLAFYFCKCSVKQT
jgi:hypothetical protein